MWLQLALSIALSVGDTAQLCRRVPSKGLLNTPALRGRAVGRNHVSGGWQLRKNFPSFVLSHCKVV